MLKIVYLSLGSNVGDREGELRTASAALQSPEFQIKRFSSVYETAPVDVEDQPHFLNVVVEAQTTLFPMQLLLRISGIENAMGRKRTTPKGPRNIDIDILLFGRFVVNTPKLKIPHPRMTARRFVIEPLVELAPDLRHPVTRQTMRELLPATSGQFLRRTSIRLDMPPISGEMGA